MKNGAGKYSPKTAVLSLALGIGANTAPGAVWEGVYCECEEGWEGS